MKKLLLSICFFCSLSIVAFSQQETATDNVKQENVETLKGQEQAQESQFTRATEAESTSPMKSKACCAGKKGKDKEACDHKGNAENGEMKACCKAKMAQSEEKGEMKACCKAKMTEKADKSDKVQDKVKSSSLKVNSATEESR